MAELEFHDKLPFVSRQIHTGSRAVKWAAEAKAYMAHPGKWAKLVTYEGPMARTRAANTVSIIGRKDLAAFRTRGRWSATRNVINPELIEIWVMYTATDDPAPDPPKDTRTRTNRTRAKPKPKP